MRRLLVVLAVLTIMGTTACTTGTTTAKPSTAASTGASPSGAASSMAPSSGPSLSQAEASLPTAAAVLLRTLGYSVTGPHPEKDVATGTQHVVYVWSNPLPHMPTLYIEDGRLARIQNRFVTCMKLPAGTLQRPDLAITIFQAVYGDATLVAGLGTRGVWTAVTVKAFDGTYTIECQRFDKPLAGK